MELSEIPERKERTRTEGIRKEVEIADPQTIIGPEGVSVGGYAGWRRDNRGQ